MEIRNSVIEDIPLIFEFYAKATALMKSKNQVSWPTFSQELIKTEIKENRQWKLFIDGKVACIWATTQSDELIWGAKNRDPSVYIHRIATHPNFAGQGLVGKIVSWADQYCIKHGLKYVRLDTVGKNEGLIKHYQKNGFDFLGMFNLEDVNGLPDHYTKGGVCLFEREVKS